MGLNLSHLLQMRGLKLDTDKQYVNGLGRIFYRCVDWNRLFRLWVHVYLRRIFYRCVDWNNLKFVKQLVESESHLLQMRGLKRLTPQLLLFVLESHLLQMRGLKLQLGGMSISCYVSHLLQMRGLKPIKQERIIASISRIFYRCVDWNIPGALITKHSIVASFTDAWIETNYVIIPNEERQVASFTDAWIETNMSIEFNAGLQSHLLQMRGLKQQIILRRYQYNRSHLLQMRGLKQDYKWV